VARGGVAGGGVSGGGVGRDGVAGGEAARAGAVRGEPVGDKAARGELPRGEAAGGESVGGEAAGGAEVRSSWRAYRLGLLTNAANPKAGVFAVSFLPQFVPHGTQVLPMLVLLSLIWALIDMVWYLSLIWLAGRAGRVLARAAVRRRIEQVSGVVLVALGLRLATESQ
jgi:threonine/homoserine/homoserine lactone efflux protein